MLCLVAQTLGKPAPNEDVIVIRSESEHNGDGVYRYLYETSDGTQVEESGYLKPNGDDDPIQVAQGSFQYFRFVQTFSITNDPVVVPIRISP